MSELKSFKNHRLIIRSSMELFRNIKDKKFPKKLSIEEGRELSKNISNELINNVNGLKVINLWEDFDLTYYKNIGLISNNLIKNKKISSLIVNKEKNFNVNINEKEHLRLLYEKNGNNIKEMYEYLNKIDNLLEDKFRYSFDDRLGYLMSSLSNLGTGLKVSVTLHLPALTMLDKITKVSKQLENNNLCIEGLYGEKGYSYGNLYKISNKWCLGSSEEDIITNLEDNIINIINEELKERTNLFNESKINLEDKVYRAYGILKYARQLSFIECLELLSDLRLGVENDILEFKLSDIEKLSYLAKNSVIKSMGEDNIIDECLDIERANVIRKLLE